MTPSPSPNRQEADASATSGQETNVSNDNTALAVEQAAGLRALADMIEATPELAADISHCLCHGILGMPLHNPAVEDQRERLALWSRTALRYGAKVQKEANSERFEVGVDFGAVRVTVLAERDEVCERVQVGTTTVVRKERDPKAVESALAAVPEVEMTEEVPVYDWRCSPLLADTNEPAAA